MNKLKKAFEKVKAFIPFITAGDPCLETTEELICRMAESGADLIEIGIPFSDPVAEGIVIQKASERALSAGTTTEKIFDMVERVRRRTDVPLAFMTYYNPVFVYGGERFVKRASALGIDALIIPDLSFEEKGEIDEICRKHGVSLISLITPTSSDRVQTIAAKADGFIYCVSSMGVTGVRNNFSSEIKEMVSLVKSVQDIPCAVGFGIHTPAQAREISMIADGVIVGSAIVKLIEQHGKDSVKPVSDFVVQMKEAMVTRV